MNEKKRYEQEVRRRDTKPSAGVVNKQGKKSLHFSEEVPHENTPNYDSQTNVNEEPYLEAPPPPPMMPDGVFDEEKDEYEYEHEHYHIVNAEGQIVTRNVFNAEDMQGEVNEEEGHTHPRNKVKASDLHQKQKKNNRKPAHVLFSQDFRIEAGSPAATAVEQFSSTATRCSKLDKARFIIHQSVRTLRCNQKVEDITSDDQKEDEQQLEDDICLTDKDGQKVGIDFLSSNDLAKASKPKQQKKRNKNVKGKLIQSEHKLYTLSIAMMLGLRFSIYNTHVLMKKIKEEGKTWLRSEEFMHNEDYLFYPDGRDGTPAHNLGHLFKFKDYAPVPFAYIRRMFGINEYEFIDSICANNSFIEFISNSRSGQFFFYSSDGKYMVKTMTNTESKFLRRILPHYFRHCAQNPNTLITKFLGMYRVKLSRHCRDVKFIIMNSVFDTDQIITSFYDLKGSSEGRVAKSGESVKKDNDVRKMISNDPKSAFILLPSTRKAMRAQIIKDCNFLQEMKIFDYSMLIGVHYIPTEDELQDLDTSDHDPLSMREAFQERRRSLSSSDLRKRKKKKKRKSRRASIVEESTKFFHEDNTEDMMKLKDFDIQFHGNQINLVENPHQYYKLSSSRLIKDEVQNELIIEKSYWPFHRFYEINGNFRKQPMDSEMYRLSDKDEVGEDDEADKKDQTSLKRCGNFFNELNENYNFNTEEKYPLKDYESPLSSREDGGFVMDASNFDLPMEVKSRNAEVRTTCNGEIFYMGIIDILQQFNVRKRMEAGYKNFGRKRKGEASCIHPHSYADRFLKFFDEYTTYSSSSGVNEG